jgi:predicted nucleic acid-binding Zn ribbon protein
MAKKVQKIDKVLRKTLRKMDLDTKLEGYRIWLLWRDIVGEQVAQRTQPERLRNRILFVRVSSSTWMQQLQTMKPMMLEKIHKVIRGAAIRDIRFSLGEILPPIPASQEIQSETESHETCLSPEMEGHLRQIGDMELRNLIRNILLKQAGTGVRGEGV